MELILPTCGRRVLQGRGRQKVGGINELEVACRSGEDWKQPLGNRDGTDIYIYIYIYTHIHLCWRHGAGARAATMGTVQAAVQRNWCLNPTLSLTIKLRKTERNWALEI